MPSRRNAASQEIAWAARAWADVLAEVQPLVLVFEDIHWAEEPLLELIEHLATWVRESPLLIICLARPELLDFRPGWGGGRMRAAAVELDPLRADESEELLDALLATERPPARGAAGPAGQDRGQSALCRGDDPDAARERWRLSPERIPDTLQALIAARIDHLPPDEKALLHRASVIGRIFWHGAIEHLAPDLGVEAALDGLLLRDFIVPEPRSTIVGERAYKLKHVLIREVAYAG